VERKGILAKNVAIVVTDEQTLQEGMAKHEPKEVDVTMALGDTLCKGVESWAWYGLNRLLKLGGHFDRYLSRGARCNHCHGSPQGDALQPGNREEHVGFSGLWVYKDDPTDVRILGAIAKVLLTCSV
jgi:pyruvate ferredoxin oxidoreductase delta subunit